MGSLQDFGEEGVFVGRLVAADERLEALLLAQHPVEEGEAGLADVDGARDVYCLVEGELYALDQVEGNCVF
jgi:hypothetical protein